MPSARAGTGPEDSFGDWILFKEAPQKAHQRGYDENRNGRHVEFPGGEERASGDEDGSESRDETFGEGADDDPHDGPHHSGDCGHGGADGAHDERMSFAGIDAL